MERALVIGASGGIGSAVTETLSNRGVAVTGLSRSTHGLDITDEASVAQSFAHLVAPYDLIFVASGALEIAGHGPEKSLRSVTAPGLMNQFALNAMGPMLVLKHALRLMPRDRRSVFAALSARVGSIGDNRLGGWYSYRAAKSALNQLIHGAAVEVARSHRHAVLALLHPGTVATRFTAEYQATHPTVAPQEAASNLLAVIEGLTPQDSGSFRDYAGREIVW